MVAMATAQAQTRQEAQAPRIRQGWAQMVPAGPTYRCMWVASRTELGVEYRVVIFPDRLTCECEAARRGRYCWHREAVVALLDAEVEAIRREERTRQTCYVLTDKGAAALAEWRAKQRREASSRRVASFSLLKQ